MILAHSPEKLGLRVLLAHSGCAGNCVAERMVDKLTRVLEQNSVEVLRASTAFDAEMLIVADPLIQAVLLDWGLDGGVGDLTRPALEVLEALRRRSRTIPVFLFTDRENAAQIPLQALRQINDFIWLFEDTADFITGRILAALRYYRENALPPMFGALARFGDVHEYSWHTPGHTGGTAFLKSPVGRVFFDYFGENLFRSDLSISVGELGSLLDHSGPIGAGEAYAAQIFGAHRTYYVTNGSSTSNRVIMMASVTKGQIALCDRNAHKSIEHAITMSGAIPTYLLPTRNAYGIIGPIPPQSLEPEAIRQSIADNPLAQGTEEKNPVHAIVTNSTYDGLCYNVKRVEELLGQSVDRLHFDEAWYGYARFNPLYTDRCAMHGQPTEHGQDRPTVFATQSTHKLLAALSQASMIHIRDGRNPVEHNRFNEAFMMHASTSPQYAIIASNDVSAAMMDGPGGLALTGESIREAVAFRRLVARLNADFAAQGEWFFNIWQPDIVADPSGRRLPFHEADPELLATDPTCWTLKPNEIWHGFGDVEEGYCMLDPIKVSVTTPGIDPKSEGRLQERGIPAAVLTAYLDRFGIVVEKTTDFTVLFLFSLGVTKGKWGTLIDILLKFKTDYDANTPLTQALPRLTEQNRRYAGLGLRDLCDDMFGAMKELGTTKWLSAAFSHLPIPDMSPTAAYEQLVRGHVERVGLDGLEGRTLATGVVPYPPGIPLLMPGENAGSADGPALGYLRSLEAFDARFPGFGHDTHGVENEDGHYRLTVLTAKTL